MPSSNLIINKSNLNQNIDVLTHIIDQQVGEWSQINLSQLNIPGYEFKDDLVIAKRPSKHQGEIRFAVFSQHQSNYIGGG